MLAPLRQVIGYTSNLTVYISEDTAGRYTCRVSVRGFPVVSASAEVFQKGPPKVLRLPGAERIQFGSLGDTVQVTCKVSRRVSSLINCSVLTGKIEILEQLQQKNLRVRSKRKNFCPINNDFFIASVWNLETLGGPVIILPILHLLLLLLFKKKVNPFHPTGPFLAPK